MRRLDDWLDSIERSKDLTPKQMRRQRQLLAHPVLGSVILGLAWGLAMGLVMGSTPQTYAIGVACGLVGFGPGSVWLLRRLRQRHPLPDNPAETPGR